MPTCPRCFATVVAEGSCAACGLRFVRDGDLLDVIGSSEREARAATVERFYGRSPFPGYAPADDAASLLDRSRQSAFLRALDTAIDPSARVLDCGCGTGQLAAFLALAGPRRQVFGVDGCAASLRLAESFRARVGLDNLQLVRGELFDLPAKTAGFDVVVCRGVVHHTPRPYEAIARVAACTAPGGALVLGFYESQARLVHRARRSLGRVLGRPAAWLDPILRRADLDPEKKRIWIDDQYRHPEEHILPLPRVVDCLDRMGFAWIRTVPPLGTDPLFAAAPRPGGAGMVARRVGMACAGLRDPDAGLICYVARRPAAS
ncbi:MAG: class I SAM-dependent methyltransferase [Planctomycetota bacterium]